MSYIEIVNILIYLKLLSFLLFTAKIKMFLRISIPPIL